MVKLAMTHFMFGIDGIYSAIDVVQYSGTCMFGEIREARKDMQPGSYLARSSRKAIQLIGWLVN